MSLPSNFDPRRLTLGAGNVVRNYMPPPIQTRSPRLRSYSNWGWDDLNDRIASIGEWIQEKGAAAIALIVSSIPALIIAYKLIKWNVDVFSDNGFIIGILSLFADFFAIGIGYWGFVIVFGIIYGILYIVGYAFYNIFTLTIAVVACVLICFGSCNSSKSYSSKSKPQTQYVMPATTTYVCIARTSLRVHRSPSLSSETIGNIVGGKEVEVYEVSNGFARIKFLGKDGYASVKFLRKK